MAAHQRYAAHRCPRCGAMPDEGDRFCTECGAQLPIRTLRRRPILIGGAGLIVVLGALAVTIGPFRRSETATATETPISSGSPAATASVDVELGRPFGTSTAARSSPCLGGQLECTMLTVPVDQLNPGPDTMDVRFGVRRAEQDARIGTLVIATGGPGSSGIELADWFFEILPDSVLNRYDVVLFEQRGVGRSGGLTCRRAAAHEPAWADLALGPATAAYREAQAWVAECLDEAGIESRHELDRYGTLHAAADLDAYLDAIGAEKVTIFGESYGTTLAQTYAARRPERVAGLVLDAVVDPTLEPVRALTEQSGEFGLVLDGVLSWCLLDPICEEDFGGADPVDAWDDLAERLASGPLAVETGVFDGDPRTIELDLSDLITLAGGHLYTQSDRGGLLRLLAFAERGDLGPLARTSELIAGRDPETGGTLASVNGGVAAFLAIECQEFAPNDGISGLIQLRSRLEERGGRMAHLAFTHLPCLAGFAGPTAEEPPDWAALYRAEIPTLVLTSTRDPATPTSWAEEVGLRFANASVVTTLDGPHGTFGQQSACVDDVVKEFLVFGDLPEEHQTRCDGGSIAWYQPLPLASYEAYPDVVEALIAIEEQLWALPDYLYWDGLPRTISCPYGGTLDLSWRGEDQLHLDVCEIVDGWPLTGPVTFSQNGHTSMTLEWTDASVEYESTFDWDVTVVGVVDGDEVDLRRTH